MAEKKTEAEREEELRAALKKEAKKRDVDGDWFDDHVVVVVV